MLIACAQVFADPLLVTYIEKPPLYYTDGNGTPAGFLLEWVRTALTGLPVSIQPRSPRRAIEEIRANTIPICSIGWFKTPERESFALFSDAILPHTPWLTVVRASKRDTLSHLPNLSALLALPKVRIGVVAGFSYGKELDQLLQTLAQRLDVAPNESSNLRKLVAWHVDAVFVNAAELDYYLNDAQIPAAEVVPLNFPDMPQGEDRYLMCSRKTGPMLMQQFNEALRQQNGNTPRTR